MIAEQPINAGHPDDAPSDEEIAEARERVRAILSAPLVDYDGVKDDDTVIDGDARVAQSAEDRDTRTPPWKTPEGKARIRLIKRRKAQRRARRVQQAKARTR